jgi:hypothetical protein
MEYTRTLSTKVYSAKHVKQPWLNEYSNLTILCRVSLLLELFLVVVYLSRFLLLLASRDLGLEQFHSPSVLLTSPLDEAQEIGSSSKSGIEGGKFGGVSFFTK